MNQDKLKLWIDALRSGEYVQGVGQLGAQDMEGNRKYCCLGVACEVAIKDGLELVADWRDTSLCGCGCVGDVSPDTVYYDGEDSHLPGAVQGWLGTSEPLPEVEVSELICAKLPRFGMDDFVGVIDLNDDAHMTFAEIADALEQTFLKEEK